MRSNARTVRRTYSQGNDRTDYTRVTRRLPNLTFIAENNFRSNDRNYGDPTLIQWKTNILEIVLHLTGESQHLGSSPDLFLNDYEI